MRIKNLTKIYKTDKANEVKALQNVSLDLPEKGMVFLLGKSGSGKTTLLNILGGLDKATSGDIFYKNNNLTSFSQSELNCYRNNVCAFVFQDYNVIPELNVEENILLALSLQGKDDRSAVCNVLKQVGLEGFEKRKVTQLSGGQKQRVAIARALIKHSEIIFADEPTGALDSETGESIFKLLKDISAGQLVVVVSHDKDFAQRYADRIIELADGKIITDTEKQEIQENGNLKIPAKQKSYGIPNKFAVNIGVKTFKYHPFRLFFCIIFSVIAFSLLGLSLSLALINPVNTYCNAIKDNNVNLSEIRKQIIQGNYGTNLEGILGGDNNIYEDAELDIADYALLCEKLCIDKKKKIKTDDLHWYQSQTIQTNYEDYPDINKSLTQKGFISVNQKNLNDWGHEISGELPSDKTGIAVSDSVYNLFRLFGYRFEEEICEINTPEDLIGKYIMVNTSTSVPDYRRITGIVYTECDFKNTQACKNHICHGYFFVSPDFCDFTYFFYNTPTNKTQLKNCIEFILNYTNKNQSYYIVNEISSDFDRGKQSAPVFKNLGLCLGVLFTLLSFLLLNNFISSSLKSQRKQIGILKSLGEDNKSLFKIYMTSTGILGLSTFILSYVITLVGNIPLNGFLINKRKYIINFLSLNAWLPIILLAIIAFTSMISCLFPLLKISKKYPSEHLRKI